MILLFGNTYKEICHGKCQADDLQDRLKGFANSVESALKRGRKVRCRVGPRTDEVRLWAG